MADTALTLNDLELRLEDLARHIAFPETPALATAIATRLGNRSQTNRWGGLKLGRMVTVVVAVLVAGLAGSLIFVPSARAAISDLFEVGGVKIVTTTEVPAETEGALDAQLGEETTFAEAQAAVPFNLFAPPAQLGEPAAVYLLQLSDGAIVTLVYPDGLLLTQFAGRVGAVKATGMATPVEVNGVEGYWVPGPHTVSYPYPALSDSPVREVGNVLIWQQGGVVLRIESQLTLADALELAAAIR
ncbi:MAG: hypothetical protein WEB00_02350 [Dehalococcoidia bacterium]